MIQVRYSTSPSSVETATTAELRENYLVDDLFSTGEVRGVYTHEDRMLIGGAVPGHQQLGLPAWDVLGVSSHLQRRELGIINVAGPGHVLVDGEKFELGHLDGLYVGRGSKVTFAGADAAFYFVSAPAHATYPTTAVSRASVEPVPVGSAQGASERNLFRYAWGSDLQTSGLQFGVTVLADGAVWNTVPPHLHERRTEAYLYVDLAENERVFHFLGRPGATRHLLVANRQAVISPPWSIHTGAGTGSYAFVWAMAGENNDYTDLVPVPLEDL
ncbi:5-dehydro-4-deoxy-D-glucuronate isomerase [Micromonospora craterilacus]|uniref:5-dehydro-4-deoxy-D-glucuronate isomerase n=1 Tax=Micromonospora craterilacus TaxID=1655439 RepID=A0A2W2FEM9_9ACTN|nr:5-dehydro-4-deoxy-D-glucuronate isomerase [Micromonospora craterilacus]PZG20107.1 5-dehydro-4-deoxy-D-glucuronate isomerase [Micromonospora craterilacus]